MTELKRCSDCKCTILLETYFSKNRKGEYFKTCNGCRKKRKQRKDVAKGYTIQCDKCDKKFKNKYTLSYHIRNNCNPNEYEIIEDYVEIRLGKPNNGKGSELYKRNIKTKIDLDDFDINKNMFINTSITSDKDGYARININNKNIKLHRFILNVNDNEIIDHINLDKRDNRKSNLRICNVQENSTNRGIIKSNTSGYIGVSWNTNMQKYASQINYKGERIFLGYYECKKEAHKAYILKAIDLNEEFRYKCKCDVCSSIS